MNKINKILLVYAINHNHNDYRKIQMLGISYLQSALHKEGFDCDCYDGNIGTLTEDELVKYIIDKAYDFIGFSILFSNTKLSLRIAESIKNINPKVVVAFGGTNATVIHKELIDNYPFIDVVMRGAGEEMIVSLIKDYNKHGKFLALLKSCSYQNINNKRIYATEIAEIENLDYALQNGAEYVETQEVRVEIGQAMAFIVLAFSELVHVFNIRNNKKSIFRTHPFNNKMLLLAIGASAALMLIILLIPGLRHLFSIPILPVGNLIEAILLVIAPIVIVELFKLFRINTSKDEA